MPKPPKSLISARNGIQNCAVRDFSGGVGVLVFEGSKHRGLLWTGLRIVTDETGRRGATGIDLRLPSQLSDEVQIQGFGVRLRR